MAKLKCAEMSDAIGRQHRVQRKEADGIRSVEVRRSSVREMHWTFTPKAGEGVAEFVRRTGRAVRDFGGRLIKMEAFGNVEAHKAFVPTLEDMLGRELPEVTWAEGAACDGGRVAGVHAWSVADTEVICGGASTEREVRFCDGFFQHALIHSLTPLSDGTAAEQTADVFEQLNRVLRVDHDPNDLIRTWFYLNGILDWYEEFNAVRSESYSGRRLRMPASTGVGARNVAGKALVLSGWAAQPVNEAGAVVEVKSPLQCSALDYGSAFSRAIELKAPDLRRLLISGTASIAGAGHSLHRGDLRKQVELTLDVVTAIAASRGLGWEDVSRATAYLKRQEDGPAFRRIWEEHSRQEFPGLVVQADVCRDELLFELEADFLQ